ncbi:tail fiber domain-containing protein [Anabaena sp. 4-3]|uniref:tail fiber domain-containing protein n=1 Tax=Anabaena sp. 4-3 TaxID=1811979 RepID=UPI00082E5A66|nr:tail fiber domain-containing protein [Anabaena sp. 4-3]
MSSEPIKRNRYSEPPRNEGNFSARNFDEDFADFHLPLNRMQLANFQEWGVAQGLEVSGSVAGTTLTVAPGVAIDHRGQLISLSSEGKGDIGKNPPSEDHEEVQVPVVLDLTRYTQTPDQPLYLTIQFSQILRFDEGPLGRYEDAPWIRLQPVNGFADDGTSVVLARVVVKSNGELTELTAQGRRLVSKTVQQLVLRRPQIVGEQVKQVSAGKLAATDQGLQLSVPDAGNEVLLSQENGNNFSRLEVRTDSSNFTGKLNVNQDLQVTGAIASSGLSVTGNCGITQNLQVTGAITAATLNTNELAVTSNANIAGNLKISGNLEVEGDVTARDVEHVSGNVSFGDADNDEVKITGVLRSGHSSGTLQVDDALHTTGWLTVDGNISIVGRGGRNHFKDVEKSDGAGLRVGAAWNMYGIYAETGRGVLGGASGVSLQNNALTVETNGNVGIGTTSIHNPQRWNKVLDILGTTHARLNVRSSGGVVTSVFSNDNWSGARGVIGTDSNHPLTLATNYTHHVTLDTNGNFGIGTTNPGARLNIIHQNQDANGNSLIIGPTNQSNLRLGYHQNYSWIQSHGNKPLAINPIGNNVGIGTTNPVMKLDVNGWISISGGNGLRFYNANQSQYWQIYPEWNDAGDPDLMFDFSAKTQNKGWVRGWLEPEGGWRQPSDERLKQDIEPLANVLDRVIKLQPKSYHWLNSGNNSCKYFGFIAQEVEQIFPDFVSEKRGFKGMNYNDFSVVAIAAIKEQQELILQLREEVADLKEQVNQVKSNKKNR